MADTWMKTRDTAPVITSTLRDRDLNPVDISGATVRIYVRELRGETILDDDATNAQVGDGSDGTKGFVNYTVEDLDPGGYRYEWEVVYGGGAIETFPNSGYLSLAVLDDLGQAAS